MTAVLTQLLQSHALGIRIVQYVSSIYALTTFGARRIPGGAETGYELVARAAESFGLASLSRWILHDAAPALIGAPAVLTHGATLCALVGLYVLLARKLIAETYNLTPQAAFGCLFIGTLGYDLGFIDLSSVLLAAATAFASAALMAKYGQRACSWGEALTIALVTTLSPVAASLYVLVAIVTWLTGDVPNRPTSVSIDAHSPALRVALIKDRHEGPTGSLRRNER